MTDLQPGLWVTPGASSSGSTGTPGDTGTPSENDAYYEHVQASASETWVVQHNLGKYASITIIDDDGDEIEADVRHNSINQITVSFSFAFSGIAFCN